MEKFCTYYTLLSSSFSRFFCSLCAFVSSAPKVCGEDRFYILCLGSHGINNFSNRAPGLWTSAHRRISDNELVDTLAKQGAQATPRCGHARTTKCYLQSKALWQQVLDCAAKHPPAEQLPVKPSTDFPKELRAYSPAPQSTVVPRDRHHHIRPIPREAPREMYSGSAISQGPSPNLRGWERGPHLPLYPSTWTTTRSWLATRLRMLLCVCV